MKIKILCDQFDCTFNEGNHVHHDHDNDICTHPYPAIQKTYPKNIGELIICNSKATKQWDNPHTPSCDNCETPDSDNCINCCHKPKSNG
jgi:hypothetical protein